MTSDDNEETKAAIEVHGAGSCLVDDFLGIGGLEQCLVLPQVLRDETSCVRVATLGGDNVLSLTLLQNSILTDGVGLILFSDQVDHQNIQVSTTIKNKKEYGVSVASIEMSPLEVSTQGEMMMTRPAANGGTAPTIVRFDDPIVFVQNIEAEGTTTKTKGESTLQVDHPWMDVIARTMENQSSCKED